MFEVVRSQAQTLPRLRLLKMASIEAPLLYVAAEAYSNRMTLVVFALWHALLVHTNEELYAGRNSNMVIHDRTVRTTIRLTKKVVSRSVSVNQPFASAYGIPSTRHAIRL